jgi:acetolactate synthase-1/2/3 large subunit
MKGRPNGPAILVATKGARAHDYLNPVNGGAIGGGLPMARGAAIACPDRKVVHLQADGSGVYTVQTLWTMVREKTDIVVILLKNDPYAILCLEMARVREKELNARMKSMLDLGYPTLDWVRSRADTGVPTTRAAARRIFIGSSRRRSALRARI